MKRVTYIISLFLVSCSAGPGSGKITAATILGNPDYQVPDKTVKN